MAHVDPPVPSLADLDRLAGRMRRVTGRVGGIVEELESFELELDAWRKALAMSGAGRARNGAGRAALRAVKAACSVEAALKRAAQAGIAAIKIERRPDGSAVATVDGKRLDLPRRLADVLAVLLAEAAASARVVPLSELTDRVAQKSGTPLTRHATSQRLCRLRAAFLDAGLSSFSIEKSRSPIGTRLLVRRPRSQTPGNGHA